MHSDRITITPAKGPLDATIRPPGSKSITNRALICAALADGESTLRGALKSEDTEVMVDCLSKVGVRIHEDQSERTLRIDGCGGQPSPSSQPLLVANSGTTIRFLTSALVLGKGDYYLDGVPRMRERPIGDLIDALNQIGGRVLSESLNRCPPVLVRADGLEGGETSIRGDVSSQFLSGLLMVAPYASRSVTVRVEGQLVSRPYVHMTVSVMKQFGVNVEEAPAGTFHIATGQRYSGRDYAVEPDASAASYFWAAAAICGGQVTVTGLSRDSLQGDVAFCDCLAAAGCGVSYEPDGITVTGGSLRGVDVDMNEISDTVQTLAAVALFASGPTTIRGVGHIRHKETDRIGDLATELRRLGAVVEEPPDGLRIEPRPIHAAEIETYQDHRMAMSLSLVGLRIPNVVIKDPICTSKTYPGFFEDLQMVSGS